MRRRLRALRRRRRMIAAVLGATLLACAAALGYLTATGSGTAGGSVGTLNAPAGVSAQSTLGSSTVAVSWTKSAAAGGLSPTGYYVKRWSGGTSAVAGGNCGSPAAPVDQAGCSDTSVADGTYTYTVVAVYRSWTAASAKSGAVTVQGDVTPPTTTLATVPASPEGSNGWFQRTSVSFKLTAEDTGSGVASSFYTIDGGSQQTYAGGVTISTPGDHTVTYWSVDRAGNEESRHTAHVKLDATPPNTTLAINPSSPSGSNGWYDTTPRFTLSVSDVTSGVASSFYKIDGGATTAWSGSAVSLADGEHVITYWSTDNAGNTEASHASATVKVDTGKPNDALALGSSPSHAFKSGSTLYFGALLGGSFTLADTVSDATSGPASATFPALVASKWTHAAQAVTTPAGGPYASATYSWTSGAGTPSGAEATVASADTAGNTSTGSTLTFVPDNTAPTGGALTVNGMAAVGGEGSTSTSTTTGFSIGSRTDYAEAQSSSASGLSASALTIQSATYSSGSCGAPGSGGPYTTAKTISGTENPAIESGYCYLYTLTGTDNVGNATSIKTTVKVDATPPSAPTVSLSAATGNTFLSGSTVFINAQAGKSGSFKATVSSTDAQSGVMSIALPTGFESGGGTLFSPFETTYKWSGSGSTTGAQSATATNGVGLSATNPSAFTVTSDTSAPVGGSVSVPARAHAAVAVTFSAGTDSGGSGINTASGQLTRAEAAYSVATDTCGTFGSFANIGSAGPSSPYSDSSAANNRCYQYKYAVSDNVGNSTSFGPSSIVKVDTTPPKASAITATNGGSAHKTDTGDVITFTFSEGIDPSTITSAWSVGSTPDQAVTLTLKDNGEGNGTNKPDNFSVTTVGVHLGTVEMSSGNWVPTKGGSYSFASTMKFSTIEENKSRVTITLGTLNTGGSTVGTESKADTFKWTPDEAIKDLAGNGIETAKAENTGEHF